MIRAAIAALLLGASPALADDMMSSGDLANLIAETLYEEPCSNVLFPDSDPDLETMSDADFVRLFILQTFITGAGIGGGASDVDIAFQLGQACYAAPDAPMAELRLP